MSVLLHVANGTHMQNMSEIVKKTVKCSRLSFIKMIKGWNAVSWASDCYDIHRQTYT